MRLVAAQSVLILILKMYLQFWETNGSGRDARRPDLSEAWYCVLRAVRSCDLRSRLAILTWQELISALPEALQIFLHEEYGIQSVILI